MRLSVKKSRVLLGSVWCAFDPGQSSSAGLRPRLVTACVVRLGILTLQRPDDVVAIKARHLDLERCLWNVYRDRVRIQTVPLTPAAVSLVRLACTFREDTDRDTIFQAPRDPRRSMPVGMLNYHFRTTMNE